MSKVYLSGPILGLTYKDARFGWRSKFADLVRREGEISSATTGIQVLSPMRHEGHLAELKGKIRDDNLPDNLFSRPKMIVAKDLLDIDTSDIVVVNVQGAKKVSIGTIAELGYAYGKGKTIVTIMDADNIHKHPFVTEMSDVVVERLEDAAAIVKSLLSEGV